MSIASIPGAVTTVGPRCVLHVMPRETKPEELILIAADLAAAGHDLECWHPWWGEATRVQHLMAIATGVAISGRPFIVERKD